MKFFLSLVLALALVLPSHAQNKVAPEDAPLADVAPGETVAPVATKFSPPTRPKQVQTPRAKTPQPLPTKSPTPKVAPTQIRLPQVQPTLKATTPIKAPPIKTPDAQPTQVQAAQNAVAPAPAVAPEDAPLEDTAPGETAAPTMPTAGTPQSRPTPVTASHQMNTPPSNKGGVAIPKVKGANPPAGSTETTTIGPSDDAAITVPPWWDVPASFAPDFMRGALAAGLVVALLCGYLSVFVVLKRIAFVGVALSQMCSAGVALGFLLGFSPLMGALVWMVVGVAMFAFSPDPRRVPRESYIGAVYAVAGACGVLLVAINASGESHMLDLLQGDILAGDASGLHWLIGVYAVLALAHVAFQKEWILVSFDREAANTLGYPAPRWDFFLFLTIGLAIALANRTVGALLTSALLILPGATALLLCSRLRAALWLAPLLTVIPVVLGLHTSFVSTENAPPSALITAILFVLFVAALGWRTLRSRLQRH